MNTLHTYVLNIIVTFIDINECDILPFACEQNCTNTDGSYECDCNSSYTLNADGRTCDGM